MCELFRACWVKLLNNDVNEHNQGFWIDYTTVCENYSSSWSFMSDYRVCVPFNSAESKPTIVVFHPAQYTQLRWTVRRTVQHFVRHNTAKDPESGSRLPAVLSKNADGSGIELAWFLEGNCYQAEFTEC